MIILDKMFESRAATDKDIRVFAEAASKRYQGDRQCSKDAIIVISRQDRKSWLDPGMQVGVPEDRLTQVISECQPTFTQLGRRRRERARRRVPRGQILRRHIYDKE